MNNPEVIFTVHPRPTSDEPKPVVDVAPLPPGAGTEAPATRVEDTSHHGDTFLGNLAFLVRFAFGRY